MDGTIILNFYWIHFADHSKDRESVVTKLTGFFVTLFTI